MLLSSSNYEAGLDTSIIRANSSMYCIDNYTSNIKFKIDDYNSIVFSNYEILKKYENILVDISYWTELADKFKYRPEYLSNYLYGTTHLWYLILFLNKMTNCSEFSKNYVRVIHPDNIGVLNEIYNIEKNHLKDLNVGYPGDMMLKKLDEGSDVIYKKPSYDYLEFLEAASPDIKPSEDSIEDFIPLIFNKDRAYLTQPVYYEKPLGLTYSSNKIEGKVVSKEQQIVSIKPIYMGNSCNVYINDSYLFSCPDNTKEFNTFKNRHYSKTMNKVLYNKYEYSESVDWYNSNTNAIFVKINANFKNITGDLRLKVSYKFAAGDRYETRKIVLDGKNNDVYLVLDISANYGSFNSITFSLLGDFSQYSDSDLISIDFAPTEFIYENFLFEKDQYYDLRIDYTGKGNTIIPLISYKFKDYHAIDKDDLVTKNIENRISEITKTTSPNNIIINSNNTFKGLQLISLIDNDELKGSSSNNYLEDINSNMLYDLNDLLLFYKTPNTGNRNNFKINDIYISANITSKNNLTKENGAMGFFFKGKRRIENENGLLTVKSYAYIYLLGLYRQFPDNDQCLLSGLYKLDPNKDNIDLDSEGLNFSSLVKIADTSQILPGNEGNDTFVKIVTRGNNIKIYNNTDKNPVIDYYDSEEIKFDIDEQPSFGLALYNVRNPIYKNIIAMGREGDRLG